MSDELRRQLESLPDVRSSRAHMWTVAENDLLLRFWSTKNKRQVAKLLGVCENIAREHYRALVKGKGS